MGYARSPADGIGGDGLALTVGMIAFTALSLYNAVELNVIIFSSFKR